LKTHSRPTTSFSLRWLLVLAVAWGCGDDDARVQHDAALDGSTDASVDALIDATHEDAGCMNANAAFSAFVAANRSCQQNDDCTIIGDCGPNADFTAIRWEAASEGMRLMAARCEGAWDGPFFRAVCNAGSCTAVEVDISEGCCGCQLPEDAGSGDSGS